MSAFLLSSLMSEGKRQDQDTLMYYSVYNIVIICVYYSVYIPSWCVQLGSFRVVQYFMRHNIVALHLQM